ncbi:DUF1266 domain-containing protein [Thiospirochaeta perfilievii]|nr:DUF1266 domain-containing protein [Thiospirochaeta perfilievii]
MQKFKNIFLFLLLISIFSCSTVDKQISDYGVGDIEGVVINQTLVDNLEDKWDLKKSSKNTKTYSYNNITIVSNESGLIDNISINYSNLKDYSYTLEPFKNTNSLDDVIDILDSAGFNYAIRLKECYVQSDLGYVLITILNAYHIDFPNISYLFSFNEYSTTKNSELEPLLKKITLNYGDENSYETSLFNNTYEEITLDDELRQALGMSSLLHSLNYNIEERIQSFEKDELYKSAQILDNSWGITGRDQFFEKIENLNKNGYSSRLKSILDLYVSSKNRSILDFIVDNNIDSSDAKRLVFITQYPDMMENLRARLLKAWDYGRGISVCRWAYDAGYITLDESIKMIREYRDEILLLYNSWEDFSSNYIWGRMFWAAGFKDINETGNKSLNMYSQLRLREFNIWSKPWLLDGVKRSDNNFNTKILDILHTNDNLQQAITLYYDGLDLYNDTKYKDAASKFAKSYNSSLRLDYPFKMALLLNAFSLRNAGELDISSERFKLHTDRFPDDIYGPIYYIESLEKENKINEAYTQLKSLGEKYNTLVDYYRVYTRILLNLNKLDEAEVVIQKYNINIKDDNKPEYMLLLTAELYFSRADYNASLKYLDQCYYFYSTNIRVNYLTGYSHLNKIEPDYERAYYFFNEAIKVGGKLPKDVLDFLEFYDEQESFKAVEIDSSSIG